MGSGSRVPCIHDSGTRWRWSVSFMPQLLHSKGKESSECFSGHMTGLDVIAKKMNTSIVNQALIFWSSITLSLYWLKSTGSWEKWVAMSKLHWKQCFGDVLCLEISEIYTHLLAWECVVLYLLWHEWKIFSVPDCSESDDITGSFRWKLLTVQNLLCCYVREDIGD
jgi:hypothetical protein